MAHPNKTKGDRAERAVLKYLQETWPGTFKTRAGFNEDLGDVIAETPAGRLVIQVKDVAAPRWAEWFAQLDAQVETCRHESDGPVIGGVIVWKTRGSADPADWRVIARLDNTVDFIQLLTGATP